VRVTVTGASGVARTSLFRVVGTVIFPPELGGGGLGIGALFTLDGLLGGRCPTGPS
jgi:hypothetical protein